MRRLNRRYALAVGLCVIYLFYTLAFYLLLSTNKHRDPLDMDLTQSISALQRSRSNELHMNAEIERLLHLCHEGNEAIITAEFNYSGPKAEELFLSACYPIEISTSQAARSMGHCSDFVQYIYYAGARLSPQFYEPTYVEHMKKCPNSTWIHGEYPLEILFKNPEIRNFWYVHESDGYLLPSAQHSAL